MMNQIPGMTTGQKKMLDTMLEGNTGGVVDAVKEVLQDEDQIEQARLEFLKEPSLAEMMNIPLDVLQDKEKWAEMMRSGLEGLTEVEDASEVKPMAGNRRSA
jgi:hypothetical protein